MRKITLLSLAALLAFAASACGSSGSPGASSTGLSAGTVQGQATITVVPGTDEIDLCNVSTYTAGTKVAASDVDWSGVASRGFSVANGFTWEGNIVAPGFSCTLAGKKFRFTSGSGGTFTIAGASPGKYALVVFLNGQRPPARLVPGTNGALLTIDLPSDQGVDVGSITASQ